MFTRGFRVAAPALYAAATSTPLNFRRFDTPPPAAVPLVPPVPPVPPPPPPPLWLRDAGLVLALELGLACSVDLAADAVRSGIDAPGEDGTKLGLAADLGGDTVKGLGLGRVLMATELTDRPPDDLSAAVTGSGVPKDGGAGSAWADWAGVVAVAVPVAVLVETASRHSIGGSLGAPPYTSTNDSSEYLDNVNTTGGMEEGESVGRAHAGSRSVANVKVTFKA